MDIQNTFEQAFQLHQAGLLQDALALYQQIQASLENNPQFLFLFGTLHGQIGQLETAIDILDRSIRLTSLSSASFNNRGKFLQDLKRLDEALLSYDKAIALKSDYAEAYYNRSILRLMLRDFQKGFVDYKHRWNTKDFPSKPQRTSLPCCSENGLNGRVLIWAEQGIGDQIFYAGLLPLLAKKDVSITLSADKRLHPILRRSFPEIDLLDKDILMKSSVDAEFDAQAPIGDLGNLLGVDEFSIKSTRNSYIKSDAKKSRNFRKSISELGAGLICGISWKSTVTASGKLKSVNLSSFYPLLCLKGVRFVNLQYGDVNDEIQQVKSEYSVDIHQVSDVDLFDNLDDLLALIDACDLIVTTSNVTAHLAGSLGKRAAVLVPYGQGKFWYWHGNDENSFWYPSLRLFYQNKNLTWESPIKKCSEFLKKNI